MAEFLSPGVYVTEIDASAIVPTVSASITVFAGDFNQGPIEDYMLITNVDELITYYGLPNNRNYNDWYQCYNFLQYGNKLLVARAWDTTLEEYWGEDKITTVATYCNAGTKELQVQTGYASRFDRGDLIAFDLDNDLNNDVEYSKVYQIESIDEVNDIITVFRELPNLDVGTEVFEATSCFNAGSCVPQMEAIKQDFDFELVKNYDDFEEQMSLSGLNKAQQLQLITRNPGVWGEDIQVAVANVSDFTNDYYAFPNVKLQDLLEYFPQNDDEFAIAVSYKDEVVEIFSVSLDVNAKDHNGKSKYVENVINRQSNYIYAVDGTNGTITSYVAGAFNPDANPTADADELANYGITANGDTELINFDRGVDSLVTKAALLTAYELWDNKEELDIDIVIGNETDGGTAAKNLVDFRKDCIAFVGALYGDVVGKKASQAVSNLVDWRKDINHDRNVNFNNMFVVATGQYKYQYDRYMDKYRWVNIAGDIAGLRAQTSQNRASWWASAGLERGQIKNVTKLAFNPNQGHRDILYKNGINPVVAFPGQGVVMWGQKTLLDKASSFDRVNVRGLFNTMERALSKMAKYQVMEFNDTFTRNRIVTMIKPYLSTVQAGRGIQDFLVICDETNNTPDVISRNQLVVDIYIKPTYVAEFIHLKFTNAGTNSFSEIVGG